MKHTGELTGGANHVGLGTDMDGGLGQEQIPVEIETSRDLDKLADALYLSGFGATVVPGIMGRNWLRVFERNLQPHVAARR